MNEMAHVHEVEGAVAEHHLLVAVSLAKRRQVGDRNDFVLLAEGRVRRLDHRPGTRTAGPSGAEVDSSARNSLSVRATSTKFLRRNALLSPCFRSIRSIGTST